MVDNRLYLFHPPTGLAIGLAKRIGLAWWDRGNFSDGMKMYFEAIVSIISKDMGTLSDSEFFRILDDFVLLKESELGKVWKALPPWPWQKGPIFKAQLLAPIGDKVTDRDKLVNSYVKEAEK